MNYEPITITELDKIMSNNKGFFDVISANTYGFSINLLCTDVRFHKDMKNNSKYSSISLICVNKELQIQENTIRVIFLNEDKTITIVFNNNLPDLIIKYIK